MVIVMYELLVAILLIPTVLGIGSTFLVNRGKSKGIITNTFATLFFSTVVINTVFILRNNKLLVNWELTISFFIKYSFIVLIVSLLIAFCNKIYKSKVIIFKGYSAMMVSVSSAVLYYALWLKNYGGYQSVEMFIFNMNTPLDTTNSNFYLDIVPLVATIVTLVIPPFVMLFDNKVESVFKQKKKRSTIVITALLVPLLILGVSLQNVYTILNLNDLRYVLASGDTFIEDHYVNPERISLTFPEKKRNLILMFSESLESSYFAKDLGGNSDVNLLPNLTKRMETGVSFSHQNNFGGFYTPPGTGWSIAGMVAQTGGVGLKVPMDGNEYGITFAEFLPGLTTLGDVLHENGYKQYMFVGADGSFAGTDKFYRQHGNFEVYDLKKVKEEGWLPQDYNVFWGYEDEKLLSFAQNKLVEVSQEEEPFTMVLELNDVHFPDGYVNENCPMSHSIAYENAIECYDMNIEKFLQWVEKQPFYDNTTIVIVGDHLSMASDYFKEKQYEDFERRVFNLIINGTENDNEDIKNTMRQTSSFDNFPTILASLGVEIEGNKLGLGVNLFSNEQTIYERYGHDFVNESLLKKSDFYC